LDDFRTLQNAFEGVQQLLLENESERERVIAERNASFATQVKEVVQATVESEILGVHEYIKMLKNSITTLRAMVNQHATLINRYKKKLAQYKMESLPLNVAIVNSINQLLSSLQRYQLLSKKNMATLIAKAVFDPNLCDGLALEEVINHSKLWLRRNVFKPSKILKQMDLRDGILNYEEICV